MALRAASSRPLPSPTHRAPAGRRVAVRTAFKESPSVAAPAIDGGDTPLPVDPAASADAFAELVSLNKAKQSVNRRQKVGTGEGGPRRARGGRRGNAAPAPGRPTPSTPPPPQPEDLDFIQVPTFESCFPGSTKEYTEVAHEATGAVLRVSRGSAGGAAPPGGWAGLSWASALIGGGVGGGGGPRRAGCAPSRRHASAGAGRATGLRRHRRPPLPARPSALPPGRRRAAAGGCGAPAPLFLSREPWLAPDAPSRGCGRAPDRRATQPPP